MDSQQRIRSYTLPELLVSLAIGAVFTVIAYSAIVIFAGLSKSVFSHQEQTLETENFLAWIQYDYYNSEEVIRQGTVIYMVDQHRKIVYRQFDKSIIREFEAERDTFENAAISVSDKGLSASIDDLKILIAPPPSIDQYQQ